MQNTENRNITNPSTTKLMLTEKDQINAELIKKIMTEKKTTLPSPRLEKRSHDWKKVNVETEK